jgi:WD40 repeat protein
LKPGNILLDQKGNPRVTDFGLAKKLEGDSGLTGSGQIMGTPSYMPPEQAGGRRAAVGPAADVYALGATLYALITGRPPFQAVTAMDTVIQVLSDEPVPPRRHNGSIPPDLETICLKCLEKEPDQRYASAAALAADLRRFLAGEPITARPVSRLERLAKWARRKPTLAAAYTLGLLAVLLGGLGGTAVWQWRAADKARGRETRARSSAELAQAEAERQRDRADEARSVADKARAAEQNARAEAERLASLRLYAVQMNVVQRAWEDWNPALLLKTLDEQRPENQRGVERRGFEWFYWQRKLASGYRAFKGPPGEGKGTLFSAGGITQVAFSPDGSRVAASSMDGTMTLWDVQSGREALKKKWAATTSLMSVAFSPDGKRIVSAALVPGKPAEVKVWDAATGQEILPLAGHPGWVSSATFSRDGSQVAAASIDGSVTVWDTEKGRKMFSIKANAGRSTAVTFSADLRRLAVANGDGTARLLDTATGQDALTLKGPARIVSMVAFSPDGKRLAAAVSDQTVKLWDAATGQETLSLDGRTGGVTGVGFSPNGSRIAVTTQDGMVKVWDSATGQETLTLRAHASWAMSVAFSTDRAHLATGGFDGTMKVWDLSTGQETVTLRGHTGEVTSVAFGPHGSMIASASTIPGEPSVTFNDGAAIPSTSLNPGKPGEVKLWDAATGRERLTIKGQTTEVASVALSPNGSRMAGGGGDGTVKIWDAASGQEMRSLKGHTADVSSVAFKHDGSEIASASMDGTLKVWNTTTGEATRTVSAHSGWVTSVAFSLDGSQIASAGVDMELPAGIGRFQLSAAMKKQFLFLFANGPVANPARSMIQGGSIPNIAKGNVRIWEATSGRETRTIDELAVSVAFSPDGSHLATSGSDGTVKVWDAATARAPLVLHGHTGAVRGIAFSPEGARLASVASSDKTIRIWDTTTGQETLTLKGHSDSVISVAFSPDGHRLASASADGTIKVWDARPLDAAPAKPSSTSR